MQMLWHALLPQVRRQQQQGEEELSAAVAAVAAQVQGLAAAQQLCYLRLLQFLS
jgi:hypothetical protein